MFGGRTMNQKMASTCAVVIFLIVLQGCAGSRTGTLTLENYQPSGYSPNPCVEFSMEAAERVAVGNDLTATLSAENICEEEITLQLGGATVHHDLLLTDQSGKVLWQSLYGVNRLLIMGTEQMTPGERLTFTATWPGRNNAGRVIPAGTYRLVGILYSPDENEGDVYIPENQNFEAVQTLEVSR